jgi:hypothetical protein
MAARDRASSDRPAIDLTQDGFGLAGERPSETVLLRCTSANTIRGRGESRDREGFRREEMSLDGPTGGIVRQKECRWTS